MDVHKPWDILCETACMNIRVIRWCDNSYMALGIALRYVLEALKKTPGTKMYMFGLTALDKFKTRYVMNTCFMDKCVHCRLFVLFP